VSRKPKANGKSIMEFGLSSEQTLLQNSVDQYLRERAPLEQVRKFVAKDGGRAAELNDGLAELGGLGVLIPEIYGGVGLTVLDACLVAECFGYRVAPVAFSANAVMVPTALMLAGNEAQKAEYLPKIAAGQIVVGVALSERTGARAVNGVTTSVTCVAGKLTGRSLYVIDFEADTFLVGDQHGNLYLVAANASGLTRRRLETVDRTRAVGELIFDTVSAQILPGGNPVVCRNVIDVGRTVLSADSLGAAQCMLDQAVAYAGQREQFGRVVGSFQAVKHMCAEMAAMLEPTRAFVWYAGHSMGEPSEDAHLVACHLKAHMSEVGRFVAKTATEVHGGMGFTDLLGLHYWFKRIGLNRQLLGSPERLRLEAAKAQGLA
jgi:alkylation response protein AidB-like acyl-CoA dehydrogenase